MQDDQEEKTSGRMVVCAGCGKEIEVLWTHLGQRVRCSLCGNTFRASIKADLKRRAKLTEAATRRDATERLEQLANAVDNTESRKAEQLPTPQAPPNIKHFFSKVAGVTHVNGDGSERQQIIQTCELMEPLTLRHDEENRHSEHAVEVLRPNGQQIGYLSDDLGEEVLRRTVRGYSYSVFVSDVTGGTRAKPTRGVNLLIVVAGPGVSGDDVQGYTDQLNVNSALEPMTVAVLPSRRSRFPASRRHLTCQHCGGAMIKTAISRGFGRNVVLFLLLFCAGVVVFFVVPVCGWVAGPIICILSPFVGGSQKVWRCARCRMTLP